MNENNYNNFTEIPYSNAKKGFVKYSKIIKLLDISDTEFTNVKKYSYKKFIATFDKGAEYNLDYRKVQVLRILASFFQQKYKFSIENTQRILVILSVTSFEIIENIYEKYVSDDMNISFETIIEAYINDNIETRKSPKDILFSSNKRYIKYKTAKKIIGKSEVDKLIQIGYIGMDKGPNNTYYIIIKCPELLAYSASYYISNSIIEKYHKNDSKNTYNDFIKLCEVFPYDDLVAAMALLDIYRREANVFQKIVSNLSISKPRIKKTKR
ncbi:hypothetical protein [Clostridium beijerinckii]|nr:hypothetical protein [Clostridium beijerinckii]